MKKTKLTVKFTTQFRKDYKLAMKRGLRIALLEEVVERLAMGEPLPEKNRDHALTGEGRAQGMPHSAGLAADLPHGRRCSGADAGSYRQPQ